jgi:poly-gamma-glutamate capsule biosynthesis protein CapA/YwtB (metallophosphatase superfamily)
MARTDATSLLALAGDTMLGRGVAAALAADPRRALVDDEVASHIASADAFILNLECCISDRGSPFPDPHKRFFFRAPPVAAVRLAELGVTAVTLANNHALDYGPIALLDTLAQLDAVGIAAVGAGHDEATARRPRTLRCGELWLRVVAFADHPQAYAAGPARPGIAFALPAKLPHWVLAATRPANDADAVIVTPHWGPNMAATPTRPVRRAAEELVGAGATLVAGHSAHVLQGVAPHVLFDLGDFLDDYAVHPELRNDLGLLWLVQLGPDGPRRIRALPLALDYCHTRAASGHEADWIARRLRELCASFGSAVEHADGLLEVRPA